MAGWNILSDLQIPPVKHLRVPAGKEDVEALRPGDFVVLDGELVITAGIPTYARLAQCLKDGTPPPIDMNGAALLHFGGMSGIDGDKFSLRYINPTTSTRFNGAMPGLIRGFGLRIVGGKGGLDANCVAAMRDSGCVYLSFIGGGCTLFSESIREVIDIGWKDMIPHYRLLKLRVEGLGPAVVGIDAHGNSLYADSERAAQINLKTALADNA